MFCDQMFIASVGSYIPWQAVSLYLPHWRTSARLSAKRSSGGIMNQSGGCVS